MRQSGPNRLIAKRAEAVEGTRDAVARMIRRVSSIPVIVESMTAGWADVRDPDAETARLQRYGRVLGPVPPDESDAIMVPIPGTMVHGENAPSGWVLVPIVKGTPSAYTFDAPLVLEAGANTPYVKMPSFNAATVSSNTSSTTWEEGFSYTLSDLPTGTWTIYASAFGLMSMNANNLSIEVSVVIDGDRGDSVDANTDANANRSLVPASHEKSGVVTGDVISFEYRRNGGTTAYCGGGSLIVIGKRTA